MPSLVVVPTYQEADNITRLIEAVREAVPESQILVVDDNSPDGTAKLAEAAGIDLGSVTVLHRAAKQGLGAAYREGFAWALGHQFDVIIQMDSDFSHDPATIPELIRVVTDPIDKVDCAIGSRYVPGGSTPNWPIHRRLLSLYGNRYTSGVLGLGIKDVTSGFRAYRVDALRTIVPHTTRSNGYAFMSELARRMVRHDLKIREIPITFVDRTDGASKMSMRIMAESLALVTAWGVRERLSRVARRLERTAR
ncbi:MAG: polyprenol monophosphomannose synthase [Aquihabitans sp.]